MRAPCRVVYVIDEPRRRGFAYGTLPGHPESGEEAFVLEQRDDGTIASNIIAFSRPAFNYYGIVDGPSWVDCPANAVAITLPPAPPPAQVPGTFDQPLQAILTALPANTTQPASSPRCRTACLL
jgi:hypothetical protein